MGSCVDGNVRKDFLIEADPDKRSASNEVPSLGRRLGKVVCSAVIASAKHAF